LAENLLFSRKNLLFSEEIFWFGEKKNLLFSSKSFCFQEKIFCFQMISSGRSSDLGKFKVDRSALLTVERKGFQGIDYY